MFHRACTDLKCCAPIIHRPAKVRELAHLDCRLVLWGRRHVPGAIDSPPQPVSSDAPGERIGENEFLLEPLMESAEATQGQTLREEVL